MFALVICEFRISLLVFPSPDASDIGKGNLKLILGLVWTLILKYQISMPMMDTDDESNKNVTPKQALMGWVKSKLPPEVFFIPLFFRCF